MKKKNITLLLVLGICVSLFLIFTDTTKVFASNQEIYVYNSAGTLTGHYSSQNTNQQKIKLCYGILTKSKYKKENKAALSSARLVAIYRLNTNKDKKYVLYSNKVLIQKKGKNISSSLLTKEQYKILKSLS